MWKLLVISVFLVSGCALGTPGPVIEVAPAASGGLIVDEGVLVPLCPLDRVEVTLLPRVDRLPVVTSMPKKPMGTPVQVVQQAQQAAHAEPRPEQYQGGELVYPWQAGSVYTIYLTARHGTGIALPPGDILVRGLYLDPEAFEVTTQRAGVGDDAYDTLVVRPTQASGETQAFLLTSGGRRILLRLVVGKTGMLMVAFQAPRLPRPPLSPEEPPLVLPKPPA